MNRAEFYSAIRPMVGGGLTAVQVQVIDAILDATADLPREHVAYILATAFGEAKFTPQRENMNYSAARIRQVWPTRPKAVKFAGKPRELANSVYGDRLGNRAGTDDGWNYRGGGVDQLTGRDHYELVGIADRPDDILKPAAAVKSLVHGMTTGRYRGKKLADYDGPNGFDFTAARAIVNNDVKLHGSLYAGYAADFLKALAKIAPAAAPTPTAAVELRDSPVITAAPEQNASDRLKPVPFFAGLITSLIAILFSGKVNK